MKLDGQRITRIYTINSMYANNQVELKDIAGNVYRMPTTTILQMVNDFNFVGEKKRKYVHLIEAKNKDYED